MQNCHNSSYDSFALINIVYLKYDKVINAIFPKNIKVPKMIILEILNLHRKISYM